MGYLKFQHRCRLPWIEGHGDIWECEVCHRVWRSNAPGNPAYNTWRRLGWLGRLIYARDL
jgi:hypothetical protein